MTIPGVPDLEVSVDVRITILGYDIGTEREAWGWAVPSDPDNGVPLSMGTAKTAQIAFECAMEHFIACYRKEITSG